MRDFLYIAIGHHHLLLTLHCLTFHNQKWSSVQNISTKLWMDIELQGSALLSFCSIIIEVNPNTLYKKMKTSRVVTCSASLTAMNWTCWFPAKRYVFILPSIPMRAMQNTMRKHFLFQRYLADLCPLLTRTVCSYAWRWSSKVRIWFGKRNVVLLSF